MEDNRATTTKKLQLAVGLKLISKQRRPPTQEGMLNNGGHGGKRRDPEGSTEGRTVRRGPSGWVRPIRPTHRTRSRTQPQPHVVQEGRRVSVGDKQWKRPGFLFLQMDRVERDVDCVGQLFICRQ